MTGSTAPDDPRPQLAAALDQTRHQIGLLGAGDLARATPCAEFDVRTLLAHLVAVLRKLVVARRGGDTTRVSDPADDPGADWVAEFDRARAELDRVWADDRALAADHVMAWGTMTGHDLLDAYAHEFTVHAWDLARVTGRAGELDQDLGAAALAWYQVNVPAGDRGAGGPFAPVVAVLDGADVYTRLAGFVGRPVTADR